MNQLSDQGKALQEQGKAFQEGAGQLKQEGLEARDALKEGAGQIVQEGKQVGQEIKGKSEVIGLLSFGMTMKIFLGHTCIPCNAL